MTLLTKDLHEDMLYRGCRDCLYFSSRPSACRKGFDNCVIFPMKDAIRICPCCGCPYGRREPCVGICMKQVLKDWREERKEVPVYA